MSLLKRLKRRAGANGPGLTVAILALIVALSGGAFAAGNGGGATASKTKVVKGPRGPKGAKGAPGATGPTGSQGPVGAPGAKGDKGDKGDQGIPGTPGADGSGVTVTEIPTGEPECAEQGGALVEEEGSPPGVEVCSGEKGAKGDPGDPWTAGGTLPANGMLTGTWMVSGSSGTVTTPLIFPIHLAGNLVPANVYYGNGEEEEIEVSPGVKEPTPFRQHCENAGLNPEVKAGNSRTLCVYYFLTSTATANFVSVTRTNLAAGAGRAGGFLNLEITAPGTLYGTYAVSGG